MGKKLLPKIQILDRKKSNKFLNKSRRNKQNLKLLKAKFMFLMVLSIEISKILGELGAVGPVGLFKQPL